MAKKIEKVDYRAVLQIYKAFGHFYRKYWKLLSIAIAGLIATILVNVLKPWPLKLILDYVILAVPIPADFAVVTQWLGQNPESLLLGLVVAFIFLRLLDNIFSYIHKVAFVAVGAMVSADIRKQIYGHLQQLSMSFHDTSRTGDILARMTGDVGQMRNVLLNIPQAVLYRSIAIIVHVIVMLIIHWKLALVAFSIIPAIYIYQRRTAKGINRAAKKGRKRASNVASVVTENITAMALVQAYGREDLQAERFRTENQQNMVHGIQQMRLSKMFKRFSDILVAIGTAAVLYYGGMLAIQETILPGTLILFMSYLKSMYKPTEKIADILLKLVQAKVSGERILELIDRKLILEDRKDAIDPPEFQGGVEFKDASFAYEPGKDVLKELSFRVNAGETIALVGHSGAGKSTLISLLLRFYEPHTGSVRIDDQDIRMYKIASLRRQITVLLQDARLFNKSVFDNIAFGKKDATEAEVVEAAKKAQAHEFIMDMPDGYQTMISEAGANLSGGQKQRLNIARAIIRDTPIVILDEPATALDAVAESKVQTALEELTLNRTTFIIAHTFSTLRSADRILVLHHGELQGIGTHEELLESSHHYRELYRMQFATDLDDADGASQPAVRA